MTDATSHDDGPTSARGVEVLPPPGDETGQPVGDPPGGGPPERETVSQPSKLIRIATMVKSMLEEVRQASLDEAGRHRLRQIYERSLSELCEVLSDDLRDELSEVLLPFDEGTPTESELRIAQAQLVGWLEGLFHGIQATMMTQQMMAQQMMEQMGGRALPPGAQPQQTPGLGPTCSRPGAPLGQPRHRTRPLVPRLLAGPRRRAAAGVARRRRPRRGARPVAPAAPARLRRRGPGARCRAGRRRRWPGGAAPGGRLRRVVRVLGQRDPRQAAGHPADGRGHDLRHRRARWSR